MFATVASYFLAGRYAVVCCHSRLTAECAKNFVYLWGNGSDAVVEDGVVGKGGLLLLWHLEVNPFERLSLSDGVAQHDALHPHLQGCHNGHNSSAVATKPALKEEGALYGAMGRRIGAGILLNPTLHTRTYARVHDIIYMVCVLGAAADIVGKDGLDWTAVGTDSLWPQQGNQVTVDAGIVAHLQFGFVIGVEDGYTQLLEQPAYIGLAAANAASYPYYYVLVNTHCPRL